MLDIAQVVIGASVPLVLLALASPSSRWRAPVALFLGVAAIVGGLIAGILLPADGLELPALLGLQDGTLRLLTWALYGGLAAAAGGLWLPGPPVLRAALSGALLGELGAAAALAGIARDRPAAARLALAAMGGAVLSPLGDPVLLTLADRLSGPTWLLWPLGLVMILVAAPRASHVHAERPGNRLVSVVSLLVLLGCLQWPQHTVLLLAVGSVLMAVAAAPRLIASGQQRGERLGRLMAPLLWTTGSVLVVLLATAAGLPELAALGLEELVVSWEGQLAPGLAVGASLLAALVDGPATGLLGAGIVDRAQSVRIDDVALSLGIGGAVGGLGPLVIVGGLRHGLLRWLLQVLAGLALVLLLLGAAPLVG